MSPKLTIDDESREIIVTKFPQFVIPKIKNKMYGLDENTDDLEENTKSYNFTKLFAMLNETKNNSQLPYDLNVHDIHHYSLLYFIFIIVVLCMIWYYLKTKNIFKMLKQPIFIQAPVPALR